MKINVSWQVTCFDRNDCIMYIAQVGRYRRLYGIFSADVGAVNNSARLSKNQ